MTVRQELLQPSPCKAGEEKKHTLSIALFLTAKVEKQLRFKVTFKNDENTCKDSQTSKHNTRNQDVNKENVKYKEQKTAEILKL